MDDGPRDTPAPLDLVQRFVNTADLEEGSDRLTTPAALLGWLAEESLVPPTVPVAVRDLERTHIVREGLRELMLANNDEEPDAARLAALNAVGEQLTLHPCFAAGGGRLVAAAEGVDAALAQLCNAVLTSMAAGTWKRMKACRERTCAWAFYDHSRNVSATWCTMSVCGNRAKARGYRQRRTVTPV